MSERIPKFEMEFEWLKLELNKFFHHVLSYLMIFQSKESVPKTRREALKNCQMGKNLDKMKKILVRFALSITDRSRSLFEKEENFHVTFNFSTIT